MAMARSFIPQPPALLAVTATYKANDGALDSNVATVSITVKQVNNPHKLCDSTAQPEDTTLNVPPRCVG
jgi:hypothetical protein